MKPVRLLIKNLRSCREATVDFEGLNIFAVTGDTGVGKSSLLHAMTYALFNRANSDARNIRELVTQGETTMSVEFTFTVDGDEFIVSRMSRRNSSEHRLTCAARKIDVHLEAAVNDEIVKALHMDADTFLHTVLLRQGTHAALLTSRPGSRNRILEDIFQLADIESVQRRAEREEAAASGALRTNEQYRRTLGEDPAKEIASATEAIAALEQQAVAAKAALDQVTELDVRIAALTGEISKDDGNLTGLREGAEITTALEGVNATEKALEPRFKQHRAAADAAQKHRDAAASGGAALKKAKATTADLRPLQSDLEQLDRDLVAIAEEHRRSTDYETSAKGDSAKLETVRAKIQTETKASKELEKSLAALKKKHADIDARLAVLKEAGRSRNETAKDAATLTTALEKRQAEAKSHGAKFDAATNGLKKATAEYEEAEKALTAARIANQVAEISGHLHPGDDCPVCLRALPASFTAQQSADLKSAEKKAQAARTTRESAQAEKNRIGGLVESVEGQIREAAAALKDMQTELANADKSIAKLVPQGEKPAAVATAWAKELSATDEQVATTTETLSKKSGELAKLGAEEATALANVQNVEKERAQCAARIEKHKASFASRCERLPQARRPKDDRESVAASLAKVVEAIAVAERNETEMQAATEQLSAANESLRALEQEFGMTVREPRAQWIERLRSVAKLAKCPEPPSEDVERAKWCLDVAKKAQAEIKRLESEIAKRRKSLGEVKSSREAIVDKIGGEPQAIIHKTVLDHKDAETRLNQARQRVQDAAIADARIERIGAVRMGLSGLKDALRADKFRAHAAALQERSLLIEASKVLRDMTKGRFEFAAEFQIMDRDSNETRSAGTLSGGEQFLASLALSLGVVEIAANRGSKIESLFLDEGFDALDARTLQQAMMELRRRAHAGRMICVISHVSQVTEFVNETVIVKRSDNGSVYDRRIGPVDEDDAEMEGLVSHLISDAPAGQTASPK